MSLSSTEDREDAEEAQVEKESTVDADEEEQEAPDIEEELFNEELRIDGICGVY